MSNAASTLEFLASDTCGLPERRRHKRFYAMLKGFFDDSGNEPQSPVFVLAGWVSTKECWDAFTDQWDTALRSSPKKLDYFKMVEANSRKGQFLGWQPDERDEKVSELSKIIRRHAMFGVRAAIDWTIFKSIQSRYPAYQQDPYDILFHHIMARSVRHVMTLPVPETVEFIFDEQGKAGKRARETFDQMKHLLPQEWLAYVGYDPRHRSEKEFLPLQAADMYAWHLRRFIADPSDVPSSTLRRLDDIPLEEIAIDQWKLLRFFEEMQREFPLTDS